MSYLSFPCRRLHFHPFQSRLHVLQRRRRSSSAALRLCRRQSTAAALACTHRSPTPPPSASAARTPLHCHPRLPRRPRHCIAPPVPPAPFPRHMHRHSPLHAAAPLCRSTPSVPFTHRAARSTHPAPPPCRVSPLTLRKPCRASLVLTPPRWVVRRERGRKLSLSSRSTSGPEQRGRPRGPRWWPRPPRSRLRGVLVRSGSGSSPAVAEAE